MPRGIDILVEQICPNSNNNNLETPAVVAPALAWIGTIVKEHGGGIDKALMLYEMALKRVPDQTAYALNYLHLCGVHMDFEGALTFAKQFMRNNPTLTVATVSCARVLSVCIVIVQCVEYLEQ